jgi:hypothetical protein
MENPFKQGDRVVILRKGIEAEAVVKTTWRHEVQVRVQSNELLWRTVKTILRTLPPLPPADPDSSPATAGSLLTETTTAGGADSPEERNEDIVDAGEPDPQTTPDELPEPLVVIDLPGPKSERPGGQKRTRSRRKK